MAMRPNRPIYLDNHATTPVDPRVLAAMRPWWEENFANPHSVEHAMGREAEANARARAREWIDGLDFIARDEFEAVKAMAVAARDENDALRARIEKLEAALQARPSA